MDQGRWLQINPLTRGTGGISASAALGLHSLKQKRRAWNSCLRIARRLLSASQNEVPYTEYYKFRHEPTRQIPSHIPRKIILRAASSSRAGGADQRELIRSPSHQNQQARSSAP